MPAQRHSVQGSRSALAPALPTCRPARPPARPPLTAVGLDELDVNRAAHNGPSYWGVLAQDCQSTQGAEQERLQCMPDRFVSRVCGRGRLPHQKPLKRLETPEAGGRWPALGPLAVFKSGCTRVGHSCRGRSSVVVRVSRPLQKLASSSQMDSTKDKGSVRVAGCTWPHWRPAEVRPQLRQHQSSAQQVWPNSTLLSCRDKRDEREGPR